MLGLLLKCYADVHCAHLTMGTVVGLGLSEQVKNGILFKNIFKTEERIEWYLFDIYTQGCINCINIFVV